MRRSDSGCSSWKEKKNLNWSSSLLTLPTIYSTMKTEPSEKSERTRLDSSESTQREKTGFWSQWAGRKAWLLTWKRNLSSVRPESILISLEGQGTRCWASGGIRLLLRLRLLFLEYERRRKDFQRPTMPLTCASWTDLVEMRSFTNFLKI